MFYFFQADTKRPAGVAGKRAWVKLWRVRYSAGMEGLQTTRQGSALLSETEQQDLAKLRELVERVESGEVKLEQTLMHACPEGAQHFWVIVFH